MSDKPILDKEVQFANTLRDFYDRDSFTLFIISKGMHEIRDLIKKEKNIELGETAMCTLLDSFLTSRIGVRLVSFIDKVNKMFSIKICVCIMIS